MLTKIQMLNVILTYIMSIVFIISSIISIVNNESTEAWICLVGAWICLFLGEWKISKYKESRRQ